MSQLSEAIPDTAPDDVARQATTQPVAIASGVLDARCEFLRDLPELLKTNKGDWAAYTKDRRIGCGPSKRELYQNCLDRGLKEGEFVVCSIEPEVPSEADDPVDVG